MILLVNDANILIDLLQINLFDAFFNLPYEFHVTDLVAAEVHEDNRNKLKGYRFQIAHAFIMPGRQVENC